MNKRDGLSIALLILTMALVFIAIGVSSKTQKKRDIMTTTAILTHEETATTSETTEIETTEAKTERLTTSTTENTTTAEERAYMPHNFKRDGEWFISGTRFTWYSENVLPGRGLKIPGRYSDGDFVRDEDGYICVASVDHQKGTIVDTPFGEGKVYDTGCPSGTIDIYTSW